MIREIIGQVFNGLVIGSGYALVASGLTLLYGILGIVNFAHGELYMLGAYLIYFLVVRLKVHFALSIVCVFVSGLAFGPVVSRLVFDPLRQQPKIHTLISSLGLSVVLSNSALFLFGPVPFFMNLPFQDRTVILLGVALSFQRLLACLIAASVLTALWFFLQKASLGKAIRAVGENEDAASLMGINCARVRSGTFAVATGLAALAGGIFAPLFVINPFVGVMATLKAFAIVVVGGFGNIAGSILAALMLGVAESLTSGFVSSTYQDAVAFGVLLIVLIVRPQGIIKEVAPESV